MNRREFLQILGASAIVASVPEAVLRRFEMHDPRDIPAELLADGQWHHIALVNRDGIESLYVDGVLVSYASANFGLGLELGPLVVGEIAPFHNEWTVEFRIKDNSLLDSLRITSAARMQNEFMLT